MGDKPKTKQPGGRREPMISRADVDTALGTSAAKMTPLERFEALVRRVIEKPTEDACETKIPAPQPVLKPCLTSCDGYCNDALA